MFFYHKLGEGRFEELNQAVSSLDCNRYDFTDLLSLQIAPEASEFLSAHNIPLCYVFCHPKVIQEQPKLIAYYRGAAAISQKGVQQLAHVSVAPFEQATNKRPLGREQAIAIAQMLNRLISAVVIEVADFDIKKLQAQVLMTAGATADGSWRKVPGQEASDLVKQLVIHDLLDHGFIADPISKDDVPNIREFTLTNGYKIIFGSEPDITMLEPDGRTEAAVVEVKGGVDPAGALERYGAAKKSFDDALTRNKKVITVYLAAVITPTVQKRIADDRLVRETYNLTDVLARESERERFLNRVYWWMYLTR